MLEALVISLGISGPGPIDAQGMTATSVPVAERLEAVVLQDKYDGVFDNQDALLYRTDRRPEAPAAA